MGEVVISDVGGEGYDGDTESREEVAEPVESVSFGRNRTGTGRGVHGGVGEDGGLRRGVSVRY